MHQIHLRKPASDPFISVANDAIKSHNSSFLNLNEVDCSDIFFFQIWAIFLWGDAIRKPRILILVKIGHKNSFRIALPLHKAFLSEFEKKNIRTIYLI